MNENMPLAVDTGRGFSINYKNLNLYSKYNPARTPERIASSLELEDETLYIVPSPLLLYGIDIILEKLPSSSMILAIEIDQSLMKLTIDSAAIIHSEQLKVVRLDSREHLKQMIDELGIWRFRRSRSVCLNNGYNLYKAEYDQLIDFASFHLTTFWRNRLTLNKLGGLWIKNIILNSPVFNPDQPDNEGKAVVICGAGPSLDKTLMQLRKYRSLLYIVAVDTAISTLLDGGIVPDLVYALESQFYNLGDFHNTGNLSFNLLADISSYPQVCRMNKGRVYCTYTDFYNNKLLQRLSESGLVRTKLPPLGSVGVAAVYAALQLFKEEIYLTGLDFSYIPGQSHSKGSPFSKSHLRSSTRVHPIDSFTSAVNRRLIKMNGKKENSIILTDNILASYAKLLIDILSGTDRVYDLSDQGYPLGIPLVDGEIFEKQITRDVTKTIENNEKKSLKSERKSFLLTEMNLLLKLINDWEQYDKSDQEEIPQTLMESLKDVDYIYIDFPDRLPHPLIEISFLTRSVKSARKYVDLISRVLKQID